MKGIARFLQFLLFMLVAFSGFLFTVNNTESVALWVGTVLAPRPVGIWILLAFGCGAVLGLLLGFGLWRRVQLKLEVRQLRQRLGQAELELARVGDKSTARAGASKEVH